MSVSRPGAMGDVPAARPGKKLESAEEKEQNTHTKRKQRMTQNNKKIILTRVRVEKKPVRTVAAVNEGERANVRM